MAKTQWGEKVIPYVQKVWNVVRLNYYPQEIVVNYYIPASNWPNASP